FRCKDFTFNETLQAEIIAKLDLQPVYNQIANELCFYDNLCVEGVILVTDTVEIRSLVPKRSGLFLSELMRNSVKNICCYNIMQAEFGKYFKLDSKGLVSLTRDASEIKNQEYPFTYAIVTTYSLTKDRLYIFARKINVRTGQIERFVSRDIAFQCIGDAVIKSVER
ncbi:MAG: FlgO family outer membrane protein, partial [Thermodesulfovibrionales bacterium]|nr:FlgO family outer membrane protein [Thermodesulfovibrionales bacterium]